MTVNPASRCAWDVADRRAATGIIPEFSVKLPIIAYTVYERAMASDQEETDEGRGGGDDQDGSRKLQRPIVRGAQACMAIITHSHLEIDYTSDISISACIVQAASAGHTRSNASRHQKRQLSLVSGVGIKA